VHCVLLHFHFHVSHIVKNKRKKNNPMRDITSVADMEAAGREHVLLLTCAYHPRNGPCTVLLPVLEDLAVVTTGVGFIKVDVSLPSMLPWVRRFGIASTPSVSYSVRGEVKERTSGADVEAILKTLRKWYCKVYACGGDPLPSSAER
jgi:hypothetical protein